MTMKLLDTIMSRFIRYKEIIQKIMFSNHKDLHTIESLLLNLFNGIQVKKCT